MSKMPALFFGHGNPMFVLSQNPYSEGWRRIGENIPKPRAIVVISAHWYVSGTAVTAMENPGTIHDFGGFPKPLYEVRYPAPGDPGLALKICELLQPVKTNPDQSRGLDHGAWCVLAHAFPKADVPVVELSIDKTKPLAFHYEVGKRLSPLRDEGVLIIGSGNIVHNLHAYAWDHHVEPFDWAVRFEAEVRNLLISGNHDLLLHYEKLGRDAALSIPSPDHYLPLLYVAALRSEGDPMSFPVEGIDGGSMSMLCVRIG